MVARQPRLRWPLSFAAGTLSRFPNPALQSMSRKTLPRFQFGGFQLPLEVRMQATKNVMSDAGPVSRALGLIAEVEPREAKAVVISFVYFFFLMASYFILRPLRDTMGTIYGVAHLQELFTGTFLLSFVVAPVFAGLASRIRLAVFLPWVYGFVAITMLLFYFLFQSDANDRWIAAAFYVWLSTFNLLIVSVFWSLMADIFSSAQPNGCSASSPLAAVLAPSALRPS